MDATATPERTGGDADLAAVGSLVADPGRCRILLALDDGRALPAGRLAAEAGVSPATASSHLRKLTEAHLLAVEAHGRYRYYHLAGPAVARLIETLGQLAPAAPIRSLRQDTRAAALRRARTCYDHLAGRLGVALADALVAGGQVELAKDGGLMTDTGMELLRKLGIDVDPMAARSSRRGRVLCRPCLDWSERRPHLAGAVGAALCTLSFDNGWIRRIEGTRAVAITPKGQRSYRELFGVAPG
jgi:DNA-binding transcriptional ArsR family regulator